MAGFLAQIQRDFARAQREAQRRDATYIRAQQQAHRAAERAAKAAQRAAVEHQREQKRLYLDARIAEVDAMNSDLAARVSELAEILALTLDHDDYIDLDRLKKSAVHPEFDADGRLRRPLKRPTWEMFEPAQPTGLSKIFGGKAKYERELTEARAAFEKATAKQDRKEAERIAAKDSAWKEYQASCAQRERAVQQHNDRVDEFATKLSQRDPSAIVEYFELVLSNSVYPDSFPQNFRLAYAPESSQLVVEYELPTIDVVPNVREFRYVKTRDEIVSPARPAKEIRSTYSNVVAQASLRTLHELFESDRTDFLETVVFNGLVRTIDPATGQPVSPCLVTLRTTKSVFESLDLRHVEPTACLLNLNASVSRRPDELAPVRPVVEFDMFDRRFVEETDVLSELDQRPNLMDLTPTEFEGLIQNLFSRMGLDTKQTRPSRDGGVDCVAFDPRPIFGGKVVIQAKRYRHTVDVSSVRDLYGTVQNEGASKGILVATSQYGRASYEFASGKPLELIDGGNLLYLLAEHADMEARIIMPEE